MKLAEYFESDWAEHDGKTVNLNDGLGKRRVRVSVHAAIYPYQCRLITVFAEPINKESAEYRRIREDLRDDWSTDVLESSDTVYCEVLRQCQAQPVTA